MGELVRFGEARLKGPDGPLRANVSLVWMLEEILTRVSRETCSEVFTRLFELEETGETRGLRFNSYRQLWCLEIGGIALFFERDLVEGQPVATLRDLSVSRIAFEGARTPWEKAPEFVSPKIKGSGSDV